MKYAVKICAAGIKETRFIFVVGDGVHDVPHVSEHRQARGVEDAAPYDSEKMITFCVLPFFRWQFSPSVVYCRVTKQRKR